MAVARAVRQPPRPHLARGIAPADLRVVLVHDWLTGMRGGERVLESLCRLFPRADLLTLVHAKGSTSPAIERHHVRTSVIQRLPNAARWYRHYLPLFPAAIEGFDLDDVDLIVSTSHCAAKSVVPTGRALHICYCHSPMRYAWDQFDAYFGVERVGRVRNLAARPVLAWLARWDRATAPRVHRYLANSQYVAGRIGRYYNRDASVLYPPVDVDFFTPDNRLPDAYFLVVSALVPYKRIDVAIRAAEQAGVRLKIVGTGPDLDRLKAISGSTVEFLGSVDQPTLRDTYRRAIALVLPAEEDFGIAPFESLACGRPVIALGRGGACESIESDVTGLLVDEATPEAFAAAMRTVASRTFETSTLTCRAAQFGVARFERELSGYIDETVAAFQAC